MKAACLQLPVGLCRPRDNMRRAISMAEEALDEGGRLLLLPELFLTGFCYEEESQACDDAPPFPALDPLRALVEEHDCMFMGSIRSGRQNLGFTLDREGLGLRPKIHPFGEEKEHFDGGAWISPVKTPFGRIGLQVCYDLRFPEVARSLAIEGADMLATVAQFPGHRRDQWRTLCIARAIENQMPHIACNWAEGGGSIIVDSRGRVLAEARERKHIDLAEINLGEIILAEIDLMDRDRFREEIPCFADRRPGAYSGWSSGWSLERSDH